MKNFPNTTESPNMFRITDRSFDTILKNLHIDQNELTNLPKNSVVLEVGSGTNQAFSRALKELRPDITCVSLDPTLAIKPEEYVTNVTDWKKDIPTSIYYDKFSENTPDEQNYSEFIRQKRLEQASKTGNVVAGLAPNLPIKDSSTDFIIDSWAAGYYLDKNTENFVNYIHDISRVLKPGGDAKLYPVFERTGFKLDLEKFRLKFPNLKIELMPGTVFIGLSITKN